MRERDRHIVIAIDGPAASGKSSTAQWVAERLGFLHVDSGALYRAVTAVMCREGGDPERWSEEAALARLGRITLVPRERSFVPLVDGRASDEELRSREVTRQVSRIAQMPAVRAWVNDQVRQASRGHSIVVDGRDIGTVVFPDAHLKVFLVADPWERARRRLTQQLGRRPTEDEIADETERIVQRDSKDATQTVQAKDAGLIDTTYLTQPEDRK